MNQQLSRVFFLLTVLTGCVLIGCAQIDVKETETESNNPTESSSAFFAEESPRDDSALEAFSISDIFVSGKPFGEDRPFMVIDINDITSTGRTLEKTESVEHANGHYIYWKDEGIIYVTHSTGNKLVSLILNKSGAALNCGLKIGMKETEIQSFGLAFERFVKEDIIDASKSIAFASSVIRDEKNPVNTEDFDSLYVYVGSIPEEEMVEYGISTTSCVSIVVLVKDGTISNIILDMPTAG